MARVICLLIACLGYLYSSDTFIFSYKGVTANNILIYEEKNISSVMQAVDKRPTKRCHLPIRYDFKTSKELFLKKHFDVLLSCFYPKKTHMLVRGEYHLNSYYDRVELIIEPVRFTVDFKDEFATISTYQ